MVVLRESTYVFKEVCLQGNLLVFKETIQVFGGCSQIMSAPQGGGGLQNADNG